MITVVGASGCIGARLCTHLLKHDYLVRGVVFKRESQQALTKLGLSECVVANVLQKHTLYDSFDGSDVIINATPSFPVDDARSIFCHDVKTKGVVNVAQVASDVNAGLVNVMMLRDSCTGGYFDENSGKKSPGEVGAMDIFRDSRKRHTIVRFPLLYSGDTQFFQHLAMYLQNEKLAVTGNGDNVLQLIHSDDAASALFAVVNDMMQSKAPVLSLNNNKILHVIPEGHTTNQKDMLATLAATIGAPKVIKPFFPKINPVEFSVLTENIHSSSEVFSRIHSEWAGKYNSFEQGFAQMATFFSSFSQTKPLVKT